MYFMVEITITNNTVSLLFTQKYNVSIRVGVINISEITQNNYHYENLSVYNVSM